MELKLVKVPKRIQNIDEELPGVDPKSIQNEPPKGYKESNVCLCFRSNGCPKGTQNDSKIAKTSQDLDQF